MEKFLNSLSMFTGKRLYFSLRKWTKGEYPLESLSFSTALGAVASAVKQVIYEQAYKPERQSNFHYPKLIMPEIISVLK